MPRRNLSNTKPSSSKRFDRTVGSGISIYPEDYTRNTIVYNATKPIFSALASPYRHLKHIYNSVRKYDKVPIGFSETTYDNYLKFYPENKALVDNERNRYYGKYVNLNANRNRLIWPNDLDYDGGQEYMTNFIDKIKRKDRAEKRLRRTYDRSVIRTGNILERFINGNR